MSALYSLAALDYGVDYALANVLDREHAEADAPVLCREILLAGNDRRRRELYTHLTAVSYIVCRVFGVTGHAGHERRHEFHRIVAFQVSRLVGDDRVGRRVRLVKGVGSEADHVIEDDFRGGRRHAVPDAARDLHVALLVLLAVDEVLLLLQHDAHLLLAHGAAHQVGAPKRITTQVTHYLHYLLLVDQAAVCYAQYMLKMRIHVFHVIRILLVVYVFRDRVHRARPVQRDASDYVLEAGRPEVLHEVRHATALKLEYALRVAVGDQPVHLRVVHVHR